MGHGVDLFDAYRRMKNLCRADAVAGMALHDPSEDAVRRRQVAITC